MRLPGCALAALLVWTGSAGAEVGLRRASYADPGREGAPAPLLLWYPTTAPEQAVRRGPLTLSVAPDAPIAEGRYPLILVSHGSGGSALGHADTAMALARRGYVVATVQHAGNSVDDNRNAGRAAMWRDRPRQFSAALDAVLADPEIGGRADAARIGALGFSAGGYTVLVAAGGVADIGRIAEHCAAHPEDSGFCGLGNDSPAGTVTHHEARLRAAVAMAPVSALFGDGALDCVTIPIRLYGAEKDAVVMPVLHAERVKALLPKAPEYELVPNAGHFAFMAPVPPAMAAEIGPPALDPPGFDRAAFHERLNAEVAAFFDRTL